MLALNMEGTQIRKATLQDTEEICQVHRAFIAKLCRGHYSPQQIEAWVGTKKPEHYETPITNGIIFVAERENRVVGMAEMMDPAKGIINALYLHPEHVGESSAPDCWMPLRRRRVVQGHPGSP
jgi:hypothetical protein